MKRLTPAILLFFALAVWGMGDGPADQNQCALEGPAGSLKRIVQKAGDKQWEQCFGWNNQLEMTGHRNPMGGLSQQTWDKLGRVQSLQDPSNYATEFQYDNASRYSSVNHQIQNGRMLDDPNYRVHFQYDSVGNMEGSHIGELPNPASYSRQRYSPDEELKSTSGPGNLGVCISERNTAGQPTKIRQGVVDPFTGTCESAEGEVNYVYNPYGMLNITRDAEGHTTAVQGRDGFGRPNQVKLANGATVVYQYNRVGAVQRMDLYGSDVVEGGDARIWKWIEMDYDVMGRVIQTQEKAIPSGMSRGEASNLPYRVVNLSYEKSPTEQRVITRQSGVDGGEIRTVTVYDSLGRLIRSETTEAPAYVATYNDQDRTSQSGLEGFPVTTNTFDVSGQLVQKSYPGSWLEHFAYDSRGMLTEVRRVGQPYRLFTSDMLGRIRKIEHTNGGQGALLEAVIDYNLYGQLSSLGQRVNRNEAWTWNYDPQGRLSSIVDPVGNTKTINTYNPRGLVDTFTDGRGTQFTLEYNGSGNIVGVYARLYTGEQYQRQYAYNPRGDLEWVGETTGGTVPEALREQVLTPKSWSDRGAQHPVEVNLETDSLGRTTREEIEVNGTAYAMASTHNNLNLVETETYSGGHFIDYDYTNAGNLLRIKVYNREGGNQIWQTELTYDAAKGRHTRETRQNGSNEVTVRYFYDHLERLWSILRNDRSISNPGLNYGSVNEYKMDPLGYVIGDRLSVGDDVPDFTMRGRFFRYLYDTHGHLLVASKFNDLATFQGLQTGQWTPLRSEEYNATRCVEYGGSECFAIDLAIGNRVSKFFDTTKTSFLYNTDESLREMTTHRGCYWMDLYGNADCTEPDAQRFSFTSDGNGNLITVELGGTVVRRFEYDPWDRMVKAVLPDRSLYIYYDYDGLDRLVRRRVFRKTWYGTYFIKGDLFVWDGSRIVEIRSVNSTLTPTRKSYVYGILGTPVMSVDQSDSIEEEFRGLDGSLHAVRSWAGTLLEWYKYNPYGELHAFEEPVAGITRELYLASRAPRNPFLFKGFYRDPNTGFSLIGTRWYNSDWGRFLTRHPAGVSASRLNLY